MGRPSGCGRKADAVATTEEMRNAYAIVGELVLIASALDYQLNRICISVLALIEAPMLEPVIATIDSSRKIEILKIYAAKIADPGWRKGLSDHVTAVEAVNKARNIAAHSVMTFEGGRHVLSSPAAAKLLKTIDLTTKTARKVDIAELQNAIRKGEAALGSGENLLENFRRLNAERERRIGLK